MSTGVHHPVASSQWTRRAWFAVGFIPVGFVLSMLIGEGLLSSLGYESEDTDVPLSAVAIAGGSALLIFALPCLAAWILGRKAVASGEPQGQTPALVGAAVGLVFLALNMVGLLGRL